MCGDTPTTTSMRERMQHEPLHRGQEVCIPLKQCYTFLAHAIGERGIQDLRDQGDQRRRGTVPSVRAHRTVCSRHTNTSFCSLDNGGESSIFVLSFRDWDDAILAHHCKAPYREVCLAMATLAWPCTAVLKEKEKNGLFLFFLQSFFDHERGEQRKAERSKSDAERRASSVRHAACSARR